MIRFSTLLTRIAKVALLGGAVWLAGCSLGGTKEGVSTDTMRGQFDVTLKTYKNGQFLVDGAVLSALDTGSHFAYLKDQGRLPKTVLLERSDDSKIRKQHLQYMARMQDDYKFTVYFDDDGTLKKINPIDTEARALQETHAPVQMNEQQRGKDAAPTQNDPEPSRH
jgi:hypothetical protein